MANTLAPFGFREYQGGAGGAPTFAQSARRIASTAGAIYYGDPVMPVTSTANGYIVQATAGSTVMAGIFVGCKYLSVSQKRTVWSNYWGAADVASGNNVEVYYVNDPNAKFVAQVGGSTSTGLAAADIGANVQFNYGTPNTASGVSGAYIDITVTPTTTNTLPFRVVSLVTDPPGSNGKIGRAHV